MFSLHNHIMIENTNVSSGLNKNLTKFEVARQKIIRSHFNGSDMNAEAFLGMDPVVLPRVLYWAGRDSTGHSPLYNFFVASHHCFVMDNSIEEKSSRVKTEVFDDI